MRSRREFIEEHRHALDGMILDAVLSSERRGSELSVWLKMMRARIEAKLGEMYDELQPPAPVNGQPAKKPEEACPPTTPRLKRP